MNIDLEKIIDEIANRVKHRHDVSNWEHNSQFAPITNVILKLNSLPKSKLPKANLERIKNQIFDKIAAPQVRARTKGFWFTPSALRFATGIVGSILIVISLSIGTAVAALQSVPGQAIYPLKKVVENIQLKFTSDPAAKANLRIKFANNRLDELAAVLEKNQAGQISTEKAQEIVAKTVADLQKTTAAISSSSKDSSSNTKVSTLTKILDLTNKQTAVLKPLLSAATISNEGEVKSVLEQALETSKISKEEAIKNIENAGLKIEDQPIGIPEDNAVEANGAITSLSSTSINIGTSKFIVTKDTKYDNITTADLKVGLKVHISGEVRNDKQTYAVNISLVDNLPDSTASETNTDNKTSTENPTSDTSQSSEPQTTP